MRKKITHHHNYKPSQSGSIVTKKKKNQTQTEIDQLINTKLYIAQKKNQTETEIEETQTWFRLDRRRERENRETPRMISTPKLVFPLQTRCMQRNRHNRYQSNPHIDRLLNRKTEDKEEHIPHLYSIWRRSLRLND